MIRATKCGCHDPARRQGVHARARVCVVVAHAAAQDATGACHDRARTVADEARGEDAVDPRPAAEVHDRVPFADVGKRERVATAFADVGRTN